jgi:4'-phosphopantetheinyl transferase EntD
MDAVRVSQLFDRRVAVCVASPETYDTPPLPEEMGLVANAVAKRRREFAAGRSCARAALGLLGGPAHLPILAGPDRAPVWPSGFVGSITHCDGFCCAVAGRRDEVASLGIDAEDAGPLEPELEGIVCRPDETTRFGALPAPAGTSWAKLAFSAKEAFFKCYYPVKREFLDFTDASLRFWQGPTACEGGFSVEHLTTARPPGVRLDGFLGRWRVEGGRVYAGVTLSRRGAEAAGNLP